MGTVTIPTLHPAQAQVAAEARRFNVVFCGRRWGKTVLGRKRVTEAVLAGGKAAWFAPDYTYLERPWEDIKAAWAGMIARVSEQKRKIWTVTGGELHCYTLDKAEPARGEHFNEVVIDEAAFAPKLRRQWQSAIRPTLVDRQGRAWFLTTPSGRNFAHELWERGQARDEPEWQSWRLPSWTNPHVPREEIEAQRGKMPDWIYAQEYEAIPADQGGNPFGLAYLREAWGLVEPGPPIVYGVDLAQMVDWTWVIGLDRAGNVVRSERWQGESWAVTKRRIGEIVGAAPVLLDATAKREIFESLQRAGVYVEPFTFTAPAKQELLEGLALAVQEGRIKYEDERLRAEMEVFTYSISGGGYVRYAAPSGAHDDGVMALALAVKHGRTHGLWTDAQAAQWTSSTSKAARTGARLRGLL